MTRYVGPTVGWSVDRSVSWSPFWAAAPKGRCPVGHRGEFPYVRPYVRTSVRLSVPPKAPLRPQISPLRPQISALRPQVCPLRLKITPLRPKIGPSIS